MTDPDEVTISEDKPDVVVEHDDSGSSDRESNADDDADQVDSSETQAHSNSQHPEPVDERPSDDSRDNASVIATTAESSLPPAAPLERVPSEGDVVIADIADNDAIIAAMIANDVDEMGAGDGRAWEEAGEGRPRESARTEIEPVVSEESREPKPQLPVRHIYYFIQVFDIESQVLRTVGSFFSRMEEHIKSAVQKHLNWSDDKDFLIWKRVDGITVTTVVPGDSFEEYFVPDGACLIVRDKLSKEK